MKTRKLTALLLALCMLLSLSISAFAADDAVASGTIPDSKITWELDGKGWLTISGSGDCSAFTSKDDQPWAEYRGQITQVWFDGMESLAIPDLAYWFEDCTNLTTAEIPSTTPVIGRHAFYNCPLLTKLSIYYGEHTLDSIGEDAFWRETDNGDTLYVAYIIGYPDSSVPFHDYDWTASNRSNRYFHDLYGVYQNADAATAGGIKKAPAQVSTRASTGIVGTCPSCKQYSLQGTYVSTTHTSRGHQEYYECYKCHYVQNLGTYVYKDHGSGSYGSWTCPDCGSHTWLLDYENDATCTRNGYREYSCDCGQSKRETIYATGHSYSYGSWEQYSTSQHRREAYCRNCGDSDYEYASHSMSYGSWSNHSDTQHSRTASCRTCGYSTTDYGSHSYSTGSWSKYSDMLKMIAIGNLTGDPVLKTNEETGKPYAIMRIASDRRYKSPDGEKLTDFISIKVRGVLAERCAEFARKGCKIAASGDFETITFAEEPERQPGFLLKATEVEFLSPRKELDDAAELPAAA